MNESTSDRILRAAVGIPLIVLGFTVLSGVVAVLAVVVGAILAVTGAVGFCPIYKVLKLSTRKLSAG